MLLLSRSLALMRCQALISLLLQHLANQLTQLFCQSWCFWPNQSTRSWLRLSRSWSETPFCNRVRMLWDLEMKDQGAIVCSAGGSGLPSRSSYSPFATPSMRAEIGNSRVQHKNGQHVLTKYWSKHLISWVQTISIFIRFLGIQRTDKFSLY